MWKRKANVKYKNEVRGQMWHDIRKQTKMGYFESPYTRIIPKSFILFDLEEEVSGLQ